MAAARKSAQGWSLRFVHWVVVLAGVTFAAPWGMATPYIPSDDSQVLITLPRELMANRSRIKVLQDQLAAAPSDVAAATELARLYLEGARQSRNILYFGYAESVLKPWFGTADIPIDTLAIRADIHQYFHRFDAAVSDYRRLLGTQPLNGKAWFGMAMALQNEGQNSQALRVCQGLFRIDARSWKRCMGEVMSVGPRVDQGYSLLRGSLEDTRPDDVDDRVWILTALGDVAARLDHAEEAERYFRQAFSASSDSPVVYLPYSDFLLDRKRGAEVLTVLERDTDTLNGLLRRCLAYQDIADSRLEQAKQDLALRMSYGHLRGDMPYYNEEVRAQLYLFHDPARAAGLALEGWRVMKTPAQARWLFEAAVAANNHEALEAVKAWLQENAATYPDLQRRLLLLARGSGK